MPPKSEEQIMVISKRVFMEKTGEAMSSFLERNHLVQQDLFHLEIGHMFALFCAELTVRFYDIEQEEKEDD